MAKALPVQKLSSTLRKMVWPSKMRRKRVTRASQWGEFGNLSFRQIGGGKIPY